MGWDVCKVINEVVFAMGCVVLSKPILSFYVYLRVDHSGSGLQILLLDTTHNFNMRRLEAVVLLGDKCGQWALSVH
jgi:hypothetical protein